MEEFKAQQIFSIARRLLWGVPKNSHMHLQRESAFGCLSLRGHHQGNCHSQERKKKQPQLRKSHLTDSFLPSHFFVLNTPEEKSFIKRRMGKCPWIRPFHFLIPSPFSQSLVADGRKRKIEVGYKVAQPDV